MYVRIGGIEQWIQFNEGDPTRPLLLYLHGGPGGTSVPASAAWRGWQRHFSVVHWDQRGAGRTFRKNGEAGCGHLTIERMVLDAIEVVEHLRERLPGRKILLVGHSWGSALGVFLLQRRPELFAAFVGTGQLVSMRRNEEVNYRWALSQARRRDDPEALEALRAIGPPPYREFGSLETLRRHSNRLTDGEGDPPDPRPTPLAPDLTADDVPWLQRGAAFSQRQLVGELNGIDLMSLSRSFPIPMFFFHGTHDRHTPLELVEEYHEAISAPVKGLVRFEGCHHFVVMNRPAEFLGELLGRVVPVM